MVSRDLVPEEADLQSDCIAVDGISLIVQRSNAIETLSREQVIGIYTGGITDWAAVGGQPGRITVVNKADGRSTLELFLSYFKLKVNEIRPSIVIGDNQQGILTVAGDPNAIAYVSIGTANYEASRGVAIRLLPMDGVSPTLENVRNGSFPLVRRLNLVTAGPRSPLTEAFLRFASSPSVAETVEAQFFVPFSE